MSNPQGEPQNRPQTDLQPTPQSSPQPNPLLPGGCEAVQIDPQGNLIGIFYIASNTASNDVPNGPPRDQRCPTALLLHGIPGAEKNADLAIRLRDAGWHTLLLHFSGTWGSGGGYDMRMHVHDVQRALDFLKRPDPRWQVDPQRIALIGYSFGSRAAILAAGSGSVPVCAAVVSISGIADFDEIMLSDDFFITAAPFLTNTTAESVRQQWAALGAAASPAVTLGTLNMPALIVHGTGDDVIPYYLAEVFQAAAPHADLISIADADHVFSRHRTALVEVVTNWLINNVTP